MKKIRIDVDALAVESFATTPEPRREKGTVRGHASMDETCLDYSCEGSCDWTFCVPYCTDEGCAPTPAGTCQTCGGSCGATCYAGCGGGSGGGDPTACTACDLSCFEAC